MNTPLTWRQALAPLQQAWKQRSPREQRLLGGCAVLVLLASVWSLALAPALRTWQEAPERQARLDAQSQSMRQLQAQAIDLQKPRAVPRNEAALWLEKNLAENTLSAYRRDLTMLVEWLAHRGLSLASAQRDDLQALLGEVRPAAEEGVQVPFPS